MSNLVIKVKSSSDMFPLDLFIDNTMSLQGNDNELKTALLLHPV